MEESPWRAYWFAIAGYVGLVLIVFLLPLTMFAGQISRAKRESMRDYSAFAVLHNRLFDEKWVRGGHGKDEVPLGAPEISSLADLAGASAVLYSMRPVPFDPRDAVALALAALIPMTPLVLTMFPPRRSSICIFKVFL